MPHVLIDRRVLVELADDCERLGREVLRLSDELARVQKRALRWLDASDEPAPKLPADPHQGVPRDRIFMNTKQAANHLSLARQTLEKWRCTGGGPPFVRHGRMIRYRVSDLEEWAQGKTYPHTAAYDR